MSQLLDGAHRYLSRNYHHAETTLQFLTENGFVIQFASSLPRSKSGRDLYAALALTPDLRLRFGLENDAILALFLTQENQPQWFRTEAARLLNDPDFGPRLAKTAVVVISPDRQIAAKCARVALEEQEGGRRFCVVPIRVEDIRRCTSGQERQQLLFQAFVNHAFTVDHFDTRSPVPDDLFGRGQLAQQVASDIRHRAAGIALFGIRRVGKTSVLQKLLADLRRDGSDRWLVSLFDAQKNPGRAPFDALSGLYEGLRDACRDGGIVPPGNLGRVPAGYAPERALEELVDYALNASRDVRIVLAIDEFEHIVPPTEDMTPDRVAAYLSVVGTVRGLKHRHGNRFATIVCGINETFAEVASYRDQPNAALDWYHARYVAPLAQEPFEDMLVRIGRRMGVTFERAALERLWAEWGGHPYLARQFCSVMVDGMARPCVISAEEIDRAGVRFERRARTVFDSILAQLRFFYPNEFDSLWKLARGESVLTKQLGHLVDYGLVKMSPAPSISIRALGEYLRDAEMRVEERRFVKITPIGEGGQGRVFRALDSTTGKVVALKTYPNAADDGEAIAKHEERLIRLARQNGASDVVVDVLAATQHGTEWVLAMEYVEGESLERLLRRGVIFSWEELHTLSGCLFSVLEAIHPTVSEMSGCEALNQREVALLYGEGARIWHRDFKPANIIVREGTRAVKLLDFGVAAIVQDASHTQVGTPRYMPPDAGRRAWDATFDLYALGVMLKECTFGMDAEAAARAIDAHAREGRPSIGAFFARALAPEGSARFQTAKEMRAAWEAEVMVCLVAG